MLHKKCIDERNTLTSVNKIPLGWLNTIKFNQSINRWFSNRSIRPIDKRLTGTITSKLNGFESDGYHGPWEKTDLWKGQITEGLSLSSSSPVGLGTHWLHLCRGSKSFPPSVLDITVKEQIGDVVYPTRFNNEKIFGQDLKRLGV